MENFYKSTVAVVFLFSLSTLIFLSFSSASADLNKDIAALKEEIKTAQAKLDKAKTGETLEKIAIPVSIKNIQKILSSLSQKTGGDQNLSAKVKNLNNSLNSLERAKNKNDKPGAQKILNEIAVASVAFEKDALTLPIAPAMKHAPVFRDGGTDATSYREGIDLVVSKIEIFPTSEGENTILWIYPYVKNMWRESTTTDIEVEYLAKTGNRWYGPSLGTIRGGLAPNEEKHPTNLPGIRILPGQPFPELFVARVDPYNIIRENNEINNECQMTFRFSQEYLGVRTILNCPVVGPHDVLK